MKRSDQVPDALRPHIQEVELICQSFLHALAFVFADTRRDPSFDENHMLFYVLDDYLQSLVAIPLLVQEGIHNTCRRELRFVLEMSIKLCGVQQQGYDLDAPTKLSKLSRTLDSTNISMQKDFSLGLLPEDECSGLYSEVGRVHGETSRYVHLTAAQISERISMVDQGRTAGRESPSDIISLSKLISRSLACSLVFLFHSVPEYVVADLLVEHDGASHDWHFSASKYIAHIDEHFDYKHERQESLAEIKQKRWGKVGF